TDPDMDPELVHAFVEVLGQIPVRATIATFDTRDMLPGMEPPAPVAAAMLRANLILELTSKFIGASAARVEACRVGNRYVCLPGYAWPVLRPEGPLFVDFPALQPMLEMVKAQYDQAETFHLVTAAG